MATTIMPAYDEPIDPEFHVEKFRGDARDLLYFNQRDLDKAGDVDDAAYYEGSVDALKWVLNYICEKNVRLFVGYDKLAHVTESEAQDRAYNHQDVAIYFFA